MAEHAQRRIVAPATRCRPLAVMLLLAGVPATAPLQWLRAEEAVTGRPPGAILLLHGNQRELRSLDAEAAMAPQQGNIVRLNVEPPRPAVRRSPITKMADPAMPPAADSAAGGRKSVTVVTVPSVNHAPAAGAPATGGTLATDRLTNPLRQPPAPPADAAAPLADSRSSAAAANVDVSAASSGGAPSTSTLPIAASEAPADWPQVPREARGSSGPGGPWVSVASPSDVWPTPQPAADRETTLQYFLFALLALISCLLALVAVLLVMVRRQGSQATIHVVTAPATLPLPAAGSQAAAGAERGRHEVQAPPARHRSTAVVDLADAGILSALSFGGEQDAEANERDRESAMLQSVFEDNLNLRHDLGSQRRAA